MFASSVIAAIKYEKNLYFPGENIRGLVQLTLVKEKCIKSVELKVKGTAKVQWSERKMENGKNRSRTYRAEEEYYEMKYNIYLNRSSQILPIGTHSYEFSFILPTGIPCSFESQYGYVRHICRASVDVENKLFNVNCVSPFSVTSFYDLNHLAEAKNPIQFGKGKTICCLWCKGGLVSYIIRTSHSGYACGENISIDGECTNGSNNRTCEAEVQLIQHIACRADGKKKETKFVVAQKSHPKFRAGEDDPWSNEALKIPPLPPSGLQGCNIIDVHYEFKFILHLSGIAFKLSSSAPIYIGTIPLRERFSNLARYNYSTTPSSIPAPAWNGGHEFVEKPPPPSYEFSSASPSAPSYDLAPNIEPSAPPPPPNYYPWAQNYPDLPPPSYQECMRTSPLMEDDENPCGGEGVENGSKPPPFFPYYISYGKEHLN